MLLNKIFYLVFIKMFKYNKCTLIIIKALEHKVCAYIMRMNL
jgi:hypothetical protein